MPPKPTSTSAKRIAREINELTKDELPSGCIAKVSDSSIYEWTAQIEGPPDSVYEGGIFDIAITLPNDYPFRPPKVLFKTKIYHANINTQGGICLDILKSQWSPALSLLKVLLSISSLLADPNPSDPLMPDIAQKYLKNRTLHDLTAREWTTKYAMSAKRMVGTAVAAVGVGASGSNGGSSGSSGTGTGRKGEMEVIVID